MRNQHCWSSLRTLLLLVFCLTSNTVALDSSTSRTVTIYAWPLTASSPSPYLEISYDPKSSETAVTKTYSLKIPKKDKNDEKDQLVRIGLWEKDSKTWRGAITAASTLDDNFARKVLLHLNRKGDVWHVGLRRSGTKIEQQGKKSKESKPEIEVELVRPRSVPAPVLNEPVVLDERGRMPEKEPEKSFLQR